MRALPLLPPHLWSFGIWFPYLYLWSSAVPWRKRKQKIKEILFFVRWVVSNLPALPSRSQGRVEPMAWAVMSIGMSQALLWWSQLHASLPPETGDPLSPHWVYLSVCALWRWTTSCPDLLREPGCIRLFTHLVVTTPSLTSKMVSLLLNTAVS